MPATELLTYAGCMNNTRNSASEADLQLLEEACRKGVLLEFWELRYQVTNLMISLGLSPPLCSQGRHVPALRNWCQESYGTHISFTD
jgi:hypothetical protein